MRDSLWLRAIPWLALAVAAACGGTSPGNTPVEGSGMSAGSGSNGGSGTATSGDGVSQSGTTVPTSGSVGPGSGTTSGNGSGTATTGSTSGSVGSGTSSGVGSPSGASSGAGGTGATTGTSSGAGGTGATSGASSGTGSSGTIMGNGRHGMSMGCGVTPAGAQSASFTNHKLAIPKCPAGCSAAMGNCSRDCIAPEFWPGAVSDQEVGGDTFINRDFSIELPTNYQTTTPYPVFMGGGGCGGGPPQNGDGYGIQETGAIKIGLGYILRCFADGGSACAGSIKNEPLCVNGPEIPYVRAVLKWVESNFCVDLSKEFIGGGSSGGWEAMTAGCGDADQLRGFVSVSGGKREHQWPCMGPMAALMVVNDMDTANPIGQPDQPTVMFNTDLDSYGAAHERIDLLARNACVGTATTMYDPKFPKCSKYTGCPADFPVVWCELPEGHDNTRDGTLDYTGAMWPFLSGLPSEP
jgi:hypothetical protein